MTTAMLGPANCLVDVLRATEEDDEGDYPLDSPDAPPYLSGVPMWIKEKTNRTWDPVTRTPRTIRVLVGRATGTVDVLDTDRLRATFPGGNVVLYAITSIQKNDSPIYAGDWQMELAKVT